MNGPSLIRGRGYVVCAAILWSLSGAFVKLLTQPTGLGESLGLDQPPVPGLVIAFYRGLFAGLAILPLLRTADISFRPLMLLMMVCFAAMNALFVSALALGTAANAILLQYTAPVWMYLASVVWLREPADRRNTIALVFAMTGMAIIIGGAWQEPNPDTLLAVLVALGSGITYAGVILLLRVLRAASATWLTVLNNLAAAGLLLPVLWLEPAPTLPQLATLLIFGSVQMAIPYVLISRGLKSVSPQEVGTITLLEPLLNPFWAYLVAREVPPTATFYGGVLILAALAWRYAPWRRGAAQAS